MNNKDSEIQNLKGRILLSTSTAFDEYMRKSMVLVCEHSKEGAMGLVINKVVPGAGYLSILDTLGDNEIAGVEKYKHIDIHLGGDRDIDKCFILQSSDHPTINSKPISDSVWLATSDDLIKSIAFVSEEPSRKILCVGCCLWEPSQLENEIAANYWIPITADEGLIFGNSHADKWSKAFLKIGLHTEFFIANFGNA